MATDFDKRNGFKKSLLAIGCTPDYIMMELGSGRVGSKCTASIHHSCCLRSSVTTFGSALPRVFFMICPMKKLKSFVFPLL